MTQNTTDAAQAGAAKQPRCVLIVHGVGEQKKSDTLLYIGSPLVGWILEWARAFYTELRTQVGPVELSFVPYDVGAGDTPAYGVLELPDQKWFFAEAWWAGSSFHPDLATMLGWSLAHLGDILAQMLRNTAERARHLIPGQASSTQPGAIWQLVDLVNCVALGVGYAVAAPLGYALLLPLMLLAQIPIESVQNFIVIKLLRPALTSGAGEFRMYLDDEMQSANVRRRVGESARWLMNKAACDELIVIAHSEGCVVSLGMLTDRTYEDVARRTRKLLTFGAGLNKSWLVKPRLHRLFEPLTGDIQWADFWASYDPVPAGPLDPSRHRLEPDSRKCQVSDIYRPSGLADAQSRKNAGGVSEQVTNGMNVLTDHGGYFRNDEQVVLRLAAEISAPIHTESSFWPGEDVLRAFVRGRRVRVAALALWRDVAVAGWLAASMIAFALILQQGVKAWAPVSSITAPIGPAGGILDALRFLHTSDQQVFPPLQDIAGVLLNLPAFLGVALLLGVVAWVVYRLFEWRVWRWWDRAARDEFLKQSVASSLARAQSRVDVTAIARPGESLYRSP
jgi:hypothetical protein